MTAFLVLSLPSVGTIEIGPAKILTNWPSEMIAHYDRHNLLVDSPVIRRMLQSTSPFTYDVASINSTRNDDKRSAVAELFDRYEMGTGAYFQCVMPPVAVVPYHFWSTAFRFRRDDEASIYHDVRIRRALAACS